MIKLSKLLLEVTSSPIAIFLAGSAGAGKSTFRTEFLDPVADFTVLNVDDEYEPLLQKAGLPLDFRKFQGPEDLSAAGSAMAQAQKIHRSKYEKSKVDMSHIIIDGTGGSSREILKKKKELEELGYKTAMVLIFVPPDISLSRNIKRGDEGGRTLMPSIILRSWSNMFSNIDLYKKEFGDSFILYKAYDEKDVVFPKFDPTDPEVRKQFFDPFKVKGKEKSPEEMAKGLQKFKDLNNQIAIQISKINDLHFDDPTEIKTKINRLVNA
jgi:predicted ABC-type ATPase